MTTIQGLAIKSPETIRDDFLRTYRNGLIRRGIANPDTSEGTEIYTKATSLAQQIYAASTNTPLAADAQMADSAQADDLVRLAGLYKLALRPAGPSSGPLVFAASVSTAIAIAQGSQLIDSAGLIYEVAVGGSYVAGVDVPLRAVATGAATNLPEGAVVRWIAPPAFVFTNAAVGLGGLTGGVDAEDFEGLRSRLLERIQKPPNGSNWPSLTAAAEGASTAVQKAFAYPACNGPSTCHYAVTRAPTAGNKHRDVDPLVGSTVIPAVLAAFPEFVEVSGTTVSNYPVDVSIALALPASPKASPAGPGGGWTDANPFPAYASQGYSDVQAVVSTTRFVVPSDVAPVVGSQVCWISADDWVFRTAKVTAVNSVSGSICDVTVDTPFVSTSGVSIAIGDWVFPNAERMGAYVAAYFDAMAKLGPGEKTTSSNLLPRAYRRPLATSAWPSQLQRAFLRQITDAGEEVQDVDYLYRSATTPSLPGLITGAPYIFVPAKVAFYPI